MDTRAKMMEERLWKERDLLAGLKRELGAKRELLELANSHWGYEDGLYRFYHGSYKVYDLQAYTLKIVEVLTKAAPEGRGLCDSFRDIVAKGTGKVFAMDVDQRWDEETVPITTAFLHAKYFLEMAVRYSDLEEPPQPMPSGYAALLCLFEMR